MNTTANKNKIEFTEFLKNNMRQSSDHFANLPDVAEIEYVEIAKIRYPKYLDEFWTSKQRQASSLHEISYRACFKAELPHYFIELFTKKEDIVYDPFSGRGTTIIEAALMGRNVISNDVNPLSKIISLPRLNIPSVQEIEGRLAYVPIDRNAKADIDLSMFYHPDTEAEIVSLKYYLQSREDCGQNDHIDSWIRMMATNRLTGHSPGFFSVYTLPPNQAVSQERQKKINLKRNQRPPYRDVKKLILKKTISLTKDISETQKKGLLRIAEDARFLTNDAGNTSEIIDGSIQLTVTSPPFLNVVQYASDNWLRCWFNNIDMGKVEKSITNSGSILEWSIVMSKVFKELYRITRSGGWVAFEVGEVRNGKVKLDESVIPLGIDAGFNCLGIFINKQVFTKTSNIWGVTNNSKGTNSNRIVLFYKE